MRAPFLRQGDGKITHKRGNFLIALIVVSLSSFFMLGSAIFSGVKKESGEGDVFSDLDAYGYGSTSPLDGRG